MNGQPVAPIGGGLNESRTPGEQPAGTYREGLNVRGIDPRTGRAVWGAQRAGLEKLSDDLPGGSHARHFTVASKLLFAREQRALGLDALAGAVPDVVTRAWQEQLAERVLDVSVGVDGQGYFLLDSGDVAVLNTKGRKVDQILSAVPRGFTAVPRVFASADGSVYTAATRDEEFAGGAGRVYRWVKQEDKTWTQAYEAVIETSISTFVEGFGVLYVAEDGPADEEGVRPPAALTRIGAPSLGPEIAWRQTVFPRPCFDLTLTPNGQVFSSHPSNPERGAGADGVLFTARNVGWTPYELPAFDIGNVWSWIDAQAANDDGDDLEDGEEVVRLRDRRFFETDFAPLDPDIPERELSRSGSALFPPPTWSEEAFGGVGAVRFSGDSALVSGATSSLNDVAEQLALIPANFPAWTMVMLVEFTSAQGLQSSVRRILSQRTDLTNQADWTLDTLGLAVSLRDNRPTGGVSTQTATTATTARTALLTFEATGDGSTMRVRLNGLDLAGSQTFPGLDQGGPYQISGSTVEAPGPYTTLGAGSPTQISLIDPGTCVVTNALGGSSGELRSMIDGVSQSGGFAFVAGNDLRNDIDFDFGAPVQLDSFSIWYSQNPSASPSIQVKFGNVAGLANPDIDRTVSLEDLSGVLRAEASTNDDSGNGYRYANLRIVSGSVVVHEFQVHRQGTPDAQSGAEFNLAEMLFFRNVSTSNTQLVEGYMAHRWGVSHTLDSAHPYAGPGNFPEGTGGTSQDSALVAADLDSPKAILAKYGANGEPLAVYTGNGVGCGAAYDNGKVFAIGEPDTGAESDLDFGATLTRFKDDARALDREAAITSAVFTVDREPIGIEAGPCSTIFAATKEGIRRIDGLTMSQEWLFPSAFPRALRAAPAGLQFDATLQGGDCGPEYLYVAQEGLDGAARLTTLGLTETGTEKGRATELLVVTSAGDVLRRVDGDWDTVEAGALPGERPASATLFGRTVFADGIGYRVYDHQLRQLRNFEEAVSGNFPPRCELIAAYRGRLILAGGDNAFTVYQSAYGDVFDFNYGQEVQTIAQAVAGTVASQGLSPEPITALMPWRDDLLYIGTTESLFVLTGDLADGGRLDHVDKSQGVAPGYAWCESPVGIYYFSGRGGVMLVSAQGLRMVSSGAIQRRLEEVDLGSQRIELTYNWVDKTVHVFLIPRNLGGGIRHFVYEEPTGAWHLDEFGASYESAVTAAASLIGDTPEDRSLLLGLAGGGVYRWDQYAEDDAGRPVDSYAVIGPMLPESSGMEARLSGVHGQLATDQAGIEVAARGSNSPDAPGPPGPFKPILPGRGYGVGMNVTAPSLFLEVRGLGRAWCVHALRAEINTLGSARPVR